MNEAITCQGRLLQPADICWLRDVVQKHPNWSRHKITKHICSHWGWQTHSGQLKTFAARSMIDKLEQRGLIDLPAIRVAYRRKPRPPFPEGFTAPKLTPVKTSLKKLTPLSFVVAVPNSYEDNVTVHRDIFTATNLMVTADKARVIGGQCLSRCVGGFNSKIRWEGFQESTVF
jgi:hypothetical protein